MTLEQKIFVRQFHREMTFDEMVEASGVDENVLTTFYVKYGLFAKPKWKNRTKEKVIPIFRERRNGGFSATPRPDAPRPNERPKAEYTNTASPFGIADELFGRKLRPQCKF